MQHMRPVTLRMGWLSLYAVSCAVWCDWARMLVAAGRSGGARVLLRWRLRTAFESAPLAAAMDGQADAGSTLYVIGKCGANKPRRLSWSLECLHECLWDGWPSW